MNEYDEVIDAGAVAPTCIDQVLVRKIALCCSAKISFLVLFMFTTKNRKHDGQA